MKFTRKEVYVLDKSIILAFNIIFEDTMSLMKILTLAILVLFIIIFSAFAQEPGSCLQPVSQKFAEFEFTSTSDLKTRADEFSVKLNETTESQGITFVFGGKNSRLKEITEISELVEKAFVFGKNGYDSKIYIRDGGYRLVPTVIFILRPLKCSDYSTPSSDISADQVKFIEFSAASTRRLSNNDLYSGIELEPKTTCPPAARAVRACIDDTETEVYVIVNAAGEVVFSKALSSHPLLRAAAEVGAKKWKFRDYIVDGERKSRSGTVIIRFVEGPAVLSN